jgi:hypothetical protein
MNIENGQTDLVRKHRELVCTAREMYSLASKLQKLMLRMFFEEFCDLDEEEQRLQVEKIE